MKHVKLLRETYKTYEGARKRAAFENGIAPSEFQYGLKARLYRYRVVPDTAAGLGWRVERYTMETPAETLLRQNISSKRCRAKEI